MFTGIVEETGAVRSVTRRAGGIRLVVSAAGVLPGTRPGDSVAVNGCCLTVTRRTSQGRRGALAFDLLEETWRRTNLRFLKPGAAVNLERALRADGRLGGHFVSGHVDAVGKIVRWEKSGADHLLDISAPAGVMRYVVFKGCIAVDGISLTVAAVNPRGFRLWIIPHTWEVTALRERKVGDPVNLEADLLAKYAEKLLASTAPAPAAHKRG